VVRYTIRPLRWREARAVSQWHYDGPYAVYDVNMLPAMALQALFRLAGVTIYFAALDEAGQLAGFFSFVPRGDAVEVGLAMRPDLTGRGLGLEFLLEGLAFARRRFAPKQFVLDVATFNQRAMRVYERAGFRPVGTFTSSRDGRESLKMARDA
jgi:[ribosomal protein S18]-alanine N-acetyltransferase